MSYYLNYRIIPEKRIILGYASGHLKWDDIIKKKSEIGYDPLFDPSFNMLDDIRDAYIIMNDPVEIKKFYEFAQSQEAYIGKRNTALLTRTPNQVANSELLKMFGQHLPINFGTFSTLDAAVDWVGLSLKDLADIKAEIAALSEDPKNIYR